MLKHYTIFGAFVMAIAACAVAGYQQLTGAHNTQSHVEQIAPAVAAAAVAPVAELSDPVASLELDDVIIYAN